MNHARILGALLILLAAASAALASVVLEVSVERLAERADVVVRGTVVEHSVLLEPGGREIWTRYRVRVDETLAGSATGQVTAYVPGGRIGELEQEIHGVARLKAGEETVLFLWKDRRGRHRVLGQAQGAFQVATDAASGDRVCANSLEGLILVTPEGRKREGTVTRLTLVRLRERISAARREAAARQRAAVEALVRRRERLRRRAERTQRATRGKPGTAE